MPHFGPVRGDGGGADAGASDEDGAVEGHTILAASAETAEADAIWYAMAAISPPMAPALNAAVDVDTEEVTVMPAASIELLLAAT